MRWERIAHERSEANRVGSRCGWRRRGCDRGPRSARQRSPHSTADGNVGRRDGVRDGRRRSADGADHAGRAGERKMCIRDRAGGRRPGQRPAHRARPRAHLTGTEHERSRRSRHPEPRAHDCRVRLRPTGRLRRSLRGILDGDPSLSIRGDTAEQCWRILEPAIAAWRAGAVPLEDCQAGSNGPPHWRTCLLYTSRCV